MTGWPRIRITPFALAMIALSGGAAMASDPSAGSPTNLRTTMVLALAKIMGMGKLSEDELNMLVALASVYCVALGWIAHCCLDKRAFGRGLNGAIAFFGLFVVFIIAGQLFGPFKASQINYLVLLGALGSSAAIVASGIVKFWLMEFLSDWFDGGSSMAKGGKQDNVKSSQSARLARVVNR